MQNVGLALMFFPVGPVAAFAALSLSDRVRLPRGRSVPLSPRGGRLR